MIKELKSQVIVHHTWGEDIFQAFMVLVDKINMPYSELVLITTDGAPSTVGCVKGFVTSCKFLLPTSQLW